MTTPHFAFTKLVVADLDKSAAFYESVFALTVQARIDAVIAGRAITEIVYNQTAKGGGNFVLLAFHDAPTPAAGEAIIGFVTGEIDATVARAVAAGGTVLQAAADAPQHGIRVGFVADPEGHMIEVLQPL